MNFNTLQARKEPAGCIHTHPSLLQGCVYPEETPECPSFTPQHFRSQACMEAYTCDPSTREAEAGGRWSLATVWATGWLQAILRYGVRSCLTWMTPPCACPSLGLVSVLVQVVRYALTEQNTLQTARSWGNVFSTKLVGTKSEKERKEERKQASLRSQRDLYCFAKRWNMETFPILEKL